MVITDYRIQSVLRTYSKQLLGSRLAEGSGAGDWKLPEKRVMISEEARRRLIVERMTYQALEYALSRRGENAGDHDQSPFTRYRTFQNQ